MAVGYRALILAAALMPSGAWAQRPAASAPRLHVSRTASVYARPNLAILNLVIRSSAPLAATALSEDRQASARVSAALAALGLAPGQFQIAPTNFARAGGPYFGPNEPPITGIEAERIVHVFFSGAILRNATALSRKAAAVIDALGQAGAQPLTTQGQPRTGLLVFAVKSARVYRLRAMRLAAARASAAARALAADLNQRLVRLVGITSFPLSGGVVGGVVLGGIEQNALATLPYRFYALGNHRVRVSATVNLVYAVAPVAQAAR
jgi:uncharacterized protein YggE